MGESSFFSLPEDVEAKSGLDRGLEAEANKILARSAGKNRRSLKRDIEKIEFELGFIGEDELTHYAPAGDWAPHDEPEVIPVDPMDVAYIAPEVVGDVNVRPYIPEVDKRKSLRRHEGDSDGWGSPREDWLPALGVNEVDASRGKICTKCGKRKRLEFFSPDGRGRHGRDNWCKTCRRERMEQTRQKRR